MEMLPNESAMLPHLLTKLFCVHLDGPPTLVVRAPGRVNLIGEHTDYADGFVLPMAIERAVWMVIRPRSDGEVRIFSVDYDEQADFRLDSFDRGRPGWNEYVKATAWALQSAGHKLRGWDAITAGDVPIGAGLSSSAALELATARAFAAVSDVAWEPSRMAVLCQKGENEWVGVNCGIMDQMISAVGQAGHAVLIDCRSLETRAVPLPPEAVVVILDTGTRRGLVESAYNERRRQCEAAAEYFGVPALRDVSLEDFAARSAALDPLTARRAHHVITENARTLAAAEAMERNDAATLGELMNQSHTSLRDDFEVSSRELDLMAALARAQPGCYGARMTGAGFGGCAVALVARENADVFTSRLAADYEQETGKVPRLYVSNASDGASVQAPEG